MLCVPKSGARTGEGGARTPGTAVRCFPRKNEEASAKGETRNDSHSCTDPSRPVDFEMH